MLTIFIKGTGFERSSLSKNIPNESLLHTWLGFSNTPFAFIFGQLVLYIQYWTCTEMHADKGQKTKSAEQLAFRDKTRKIIIIK